MLMLFYPVTNLSLALVLISFQFAHDKQKQTQVSYKSQEEPHKSFPEGTGALLENGTDGPGQTVVRSEMQDFCLIADLKCFNDCCVLYFQCPCNLNPMLVSSSQEPQY